MDQNKGPRLVRLKEMDALKHLVRKYPDVAMDYLTTEQIADYLMAYRLPIGADPVKWTVPDYVTMRDIPKGGESDAPPP